MSASFGREAELPFTGTDARKISAGLLAIAKRLVLAHQLVSDCPDEARYRPGTQVNIYLFSPSLQRIGMTAEIVGHLNWPIKLNITRTTS